VHCSELLWSRTDLGPADVDTAQLYDGFTMITFQWLEALGFCGVGEAGPFIEEGNTGWAGRCRSTPTAGHATLADDTAPTSVSSRFDRFAVSAGSARFPVPKSLFGPTLSARFLAPCC
jgi:hypothetical protein